MKKTLFMLGLFLGILGIGAPVRFFESSADTPLASNEFWKDGGIYRKPAWRDNAYQLADDRYYMFNNSEWIRTGKENAELSVRVKMAGGAGDFAFAVGTRNNHDAGYRLSLHGNEKGVLPCAYVVFVWDDSNRTGQFAMEAPEEFRIPWNQTAEYTLKIDAVKYHLTLLVNGKIAVEKDMKSYQGGRMAATDHLQDFYIHLSPPKGSTVKASVERISVKLEGRDRREIMPPDLKNHASLIINSRFKCDANGFPYCWGLEAESENDVKYDPAGQDGVSFLSGRGTIAVTQDGIKLKKGEKYRIGAWVRAKGFKAHKSGLVICNYQWSKEAKTPNFPEDTNGEWVRWEADVDCPMPGGKYSLDCTFYGFSIVAWDIKSGTIDIRDPYLISLTPAAEFHSAPARPDISKQENAFLVPAFLAHKVQSSKPEFKFFSPYNFGPMESAVSVTVYLMMKNSKTKSWKAPLKNGMAVIKPNEKLPLGPGEIQVDLYVNGERLIYQFFHVNIVEDDRPSIGKECNNLVTELFNGTMPADGVKFFVNDWQWVHFSFPKLADSTQVMLDGKPVKLFADGFAPEGMRYLERGEHLLTSTAGTPLVLRAIPEIFIYPYQIADKQNPDRGMYDINFYRKHLWHAMNTYNLGTYTTPYTTSTFPEFEERGGRMLQCGGLNGDGYYTTLLAVKELWYGTSSIYGRAIDEISAADAVTRNTAMADAMWLGQNRDIPIYIWTVHGAPFKRRVTQMNLLSATANSSKGQGHILAESYMTNYPALEDLEERLRIEKKYHKDMIDAFPEFPRLRIEVNSTYCNYLGLYMADAYPEADLKVALDRYWHMVATDPVYKGTYGVGNYAMNHADEEMFRWLGAMFRHYFIEGNTSLLSEKYGFTLLPGHIQNGDFREELGGWNPVGNVSHEFIPGYGKNKQRRMVWSSFNVHKHPEYCDHVAVFKGNAQISRELMKLVPGKAYSLTYITAFRNALSKGEKARVKHPIVANLSDVEILHEDNDNNQHNSFTFFLHRIVFRAKKDTVHLTMKDTRTDPQGGDILLNGVGVRPYFEEK